MVLFKSGAAKNQRIFLNLFVPNAPGKPDVFSGHRRRSVASQGLRKKTDFKYLHWKKAVIVSFSLNLLLRTYLILSCNFSAGPNKNSNSQTNTALMQKLNRWIISTTCNSKRWLTFFVKKAPLFIFLNFSRFLTCTQIII